MRRMIITSTLAVVFIVGSGLGMYIWQNHRIAALVQQRSSLTQQVQSLNSQYTAAQTAANISTSSWKKFCDQFAPLCFSYPSTWTLTASPLVLPGDDREFATLTDPKKTIQVNYDNPLIKDGGSLSARIVKANHMTVSGTKLAVLGIIPVSSGTFQPTYVVLDSDQALSATPGNDALLLFGSINPRFTVGKYDAILLNGYPLTKITSYAQAQAWFDSIDGKTVLKVIESYSGQ
jgi:hypothetical protein